MYRGQKEGEEEAEAAAADSCIHLSFAKVYILSYMLSFAKDLIGTLARLSQALVLTCAPSATEQRDAIFCRSEILQKNGILFCLYKLGCNQGLKMPY